ncbi:MAG: hypothetical protein IJX05_01965 [Clostridia bacterium]|nr:hypothetical protein [Clostridia bacterium]
MKKILYTENAPAPIGPYSQGVEINGLIFFSGQIAIDPAVGKIVATDVEGQTEQVLKNVKALLTSQGLDAKNVVKTTVFIKNIADFGKVNALYATVFGEESPARSCVEVSNLPAGALVEIEIIAAR